MTTEPYVPSEEELVQSHAFFAPARPLDMDVRAKAAERGIAKIKADALRDALEDLGGAGLDTYAANEFGTWLGHRADRIEEEA